MSLDTAIQLFQLVETFEEYEERLLGVLNKCHTQEELDKATKVVEEKKKDLMENNKDFKAVMEQRKRKEKMRADESRAIHKAKMAEVTADVNRIRSEAMMKAEAARRDASMRVDDWVAKTRVRKVPVEELENNTELWCPICNKLDKNRNIINDKPSCMSCFHMLVPKSELKKYNRKYRRRYLKSRK